MSSGKLTRRSLFAGAGSAGAAATVAALLPAAPTAEPPAPTAKTAPPKGGGYALTEHVKRYYRTTRV